HAASGGCAPMPDATQMRLIMPTKPRSPVGRIRRHAASGGCAPVPDAPLRVLSCRQNRAHP
ncbi:hypothetical protein AB4M18_23510, partial [Escherichia coli]